MPFKIQYGKEFLIKFLYYWITGIILFGIASLSVKVFATIICSITIAAIACAIIDLKNQENFLEKVFQKLYLNRIKDFAKNILFYLIIGFILFTSLELSIDFFYFSMRDFFVFSCFMALATLCASIHTIVHISLKDKIKLDRTKLFFKKMLHYLIIGIISVNFPFIIFGVIFGFPEILFSAIFCSSVDAIMQENLKEPIFIERYFVLLFSFIGLIILFLIILYPLGMLDWIVKH